MKKTVTNKLKKGENKIMHRLLVRKSIRMTFLLLIGSVLLFTGSLPAQSTSSYQNSNFAGGEVFSFSKINFGENPYDFWKPGKSSMGVSKVGLQNKVKIGFVSRIDVDVEIKVTDDGKTYKSVGIVKANSKVIFDAKTKQTIIAKVAGKDNAIPFGRKQLTDDSEQAFSIQKTNDRDGYGLFVAPRRKQ